MYYVIIGNNGQLFGWREETWLWLDQIGIIGGDVMLLLTLLGGIGAFAYRNRIRDWLRRYRFPISVDEAADQERWDAIVFTVSKPDLPQWVIERKKPLAIALIDTEGSHEESKSIRDWARSKGTSIIGPKQLSDPDDPAEAMEAAAWAIRQLQEAGHQRIAVDVTGGKKPMSLGAFMAAQEHGCDTLYVTSEFDRKLNRPDRSTAKIRCITRAHRTS